MTEEEHTPNIWDYLAASLWMLILFTGFFPEAIFFMLREFGHVSIRQAFTNTPWFITFSSAGFLGWFTYARSRDCADREDMAIGKGVQVAILGMAAFLPLQIEQAPAYFHISIPFYRNVILAITAIKMAAWIYLIQLIMRYYLFSGLTIFRNMPLLFPSAFHQKKLEQRPTPPPVPEKSTEEPGGTE